MIQVSRHSKGDRSATVYMMQDIDPAALYQHVNVFYVRLASPGQLVMKFATGQNEFERLRCAIDMGYAFLRDGVWSPGGEQT